MKRDFIGTVGIGGGIGMFGAALAFVVWTWLFSPYMFGDGQYLMAFMVIFPLGWLAGSTVGLGVALRDKMLSRPQHPFLICFALIAGGALISVPIGMAAVFSLIIFIGFVVRLLTGHFPK